MQLSLKIFPMAVYAVSIPYDDSIVLQRREYTREQLDSCGWVIVYE
jgi:hypothetical protein